MYTIKDLELKIKEDSLLETTTYLLVDRKKFETVAEIRSFDNKFILALSNISISHLIMSVRKKLSREHLETLTESKLCSILISIMLFEKQTRSEEFLNKLTITTQLTKHYKEVVVRRNTSIAFKFIKTKNRYSLSQGKVSDLIKLVENIEVVDPATTKLTGIERQILMYQAGEIEVFLDKVIEYIDKLCTRVVNYFQ